MSSFDGAYANKLDNKVKRFAVDLVVEDLITKKKQHRSGILCRKAVDKAIAALAVYNVTMSRNTLCRKVSRAFQSDPIEDGPPSNKKAKPSPDKEVPKNSPPSNEQATPSSVKDVPSCVIVSNQGSTSSTSTLTDTLEVEQPTRTSGRPKASTLENKRKEEANYKACVDSITVEFSNKLTATKLTEKRLPKGWLAALILRKKEEFSVIRPIKESKSVIVF